MNVPYVNKDGRNEEKKEDWLGWVGLERRSARVSLSLFKILIELIIG